MSDASDGVPLAATADAYPGLPGGTAEKSVAPERVVRAQDGLQSGGSQSAARAALAVPCKPDAVRFAERSCVVPVSGAEQALGAVRVRPDAAAEPEARLAHSERQERQHGPAAAVPRDWSALAGEVWTA